MMLTSFIIICLIVKLAEGFIHHCKIVDGDDDLMEAISGISSAAPFVGSTVSGPFHAASVIMDEKSQKFANCINGMMKHFEDQLRFMTNKIIEDNRRRELEDHLKEMRKIFRPCKYVRSAFDGYLKRNVSSNGTAAKKALEDSCKKHGTKEALIAYVDEVEADALSKILSSTDYSETYYFILVNQFDQQVEQCRQMAIFCYNFTDPNLQIYEADEYEVSLSEIISRAKVKEKEVRFNLSESFEFVCRKDLEARFEAVLDTYHFPSTIVQHIHHYLTLKYLTYAWGVIMFETPTDETKDVVYRNFNNAGSHFEIVMHGRTLLVHYSKRQNYTTTHHNATRNFFLRKEFKDFFHNAIEEYKEISSHDKDLKSAVNAMEKRMKKVHAPLDTDNLAVIVVRYSISIVQAHEHYHHFYKCIKHHSTSRLSKCFLLGQKTKSYLSSCFDVFKCENEQDSHLIGRELSGVIDLKTSISSTITTGFIFFANTVSLYFIVKALIANPSQNIDNFLLQLSVNERNYEAMLLLTAPGSLKYYTGLVNQCLWCLVVEAICLLLLQIGRCFCLFTNQKSLTTTRKCIIMVLSTFLFICFFASTYFTINLTKLMLSKEAENEYHRFALSVEDITCKEGTLSQCGFDCIPDEDKIFPVACQKTFDKLLIDWPSLTAMLIFRMIQCNIFLVAVYKSCNLTEKSYPNFPVPCNQDAASFV